MRAALTTKATLYHCPLPARPKSNTHHQDKKLFSLIFTLPFWIICVMVRGRYELDGYMWYVLGYKTSCAG